MTDQERLDEIEQRLTVGDYRASDVGSLLAELRAARAEVERLLAAIGPGDNIGQCDSCGAENRLLVWLYDPAGDGQCVQCAGVGRE